MSEVRYTDSLAYELSPQKEKNDAFVFGVDPGPLPEMPPEMENDDDGEALEPGRDEVHGAENAPYAKPPKLRVHRMADIIGAEIPEPVWAVPNMLPIGLTIFGGRPKVGKSWLALQLAQAVGTGGVFLGREVKKRKVLYLALEDYARRLKDRAVKQKWTDKDAWVDVVLPDDAAAILPLNKKGTALRAAIEAGGYELIIIDTLSRALDGDQNDMATMTKALAPLQTFAASHGCCIVVIDHFNKALGANPHNGAAMVDTDPDSIDPIQNLGGSTGKPGTADSIWGLYRRTKAGSAILALTGRDVADLRLGLQFDPATGIWQSEGNADLPKLTPADKDHRHAERAWGRDETRRLSRGARARPGAGVQRLGKNGDCG